MPNQGSLLTSFEIITCGLAFRLMCSSHHGLHNSGEEIE